MKSYRLRERFDDELLYDLLIARGMTERAAQERFLAPEFERDSGDPFLLPDMERSVERVLAAVKSGEQVAVWSDYDCDGIPGGVMLATFLRDIGLSVRHYIPHRHEEGYGLNVEGLAELAKQGITLVITVDLGTTDHEPVAFANEKGMDVIVTDHHLIATPTKQADSGHGDFPAEKSPEVASPSLGKLPPSAVLSLPQAFAVINPKRPDSRYPFDGLCGAGVAWKLVQAILQKIRASGQPFDYAEGKEKWLLDLVGIATLSDMVPLVGENRMLAHFGLRVMRAGAWRTHRPGLAALLELLRIKPRSITEDDIGFMVAPRINAASRMDHPDTAARLLSAEGDEARELAATLNRINDERKGVVAATVKEANHRLKEQAVESPIIVMGNPKWRPGVLGLVANSLVEAHGKPTFLWGREGGETIKGSCRSNGVNVVELMGVAREMFSDFGGHHGSGGFSLPQERVHELHGRLEYAYEALCTAAAVEQAVALEREVDLAEVPFARDVLAQVAPFGTGNEKPLFMFPRVVVTRMRMFGKKQDHLEVALTKGGDTVSGVSFFSTPDSFTKKVEMGCTADIVGHVESDWRGHPRVRVVDAL